MALSKLFISYPSLDSAKVDTIVSRLSSLKSNDGTNYTLWQDKNSIPGGQDWWHKIIEGITECEVFIFIISRAALDSIVCRAEVSYAYSINQPIVPLVLQGEYFFDKEKGKNDISYWKNIPKELIDLNAQFLFYEGTSFYSEFEAAIDSFRRNPRKKLTAKRPTNPIDGKNDIQIYQEACDLARASEFLKAEQMFQKILNIPDSSFKDQAYEWIEILRIYQDIVIADAHEDTKYKVFKSWVEYSSKFPKSFITLFDPKSFRDQFSKSTQDSNSEVPPSPLLANKSTHQIAEAKSSDKAVYSALSSTLASHTPSPFAIDTYRISKVESIVLLPPPFLWVEIPSGQVTLKSGSYIPENGQIFDIPEFRISKYPITNEQFGVFIRAGGYQEEKWWTVSGWKLRNQNEWETPLFWKDKNWNGSKNPVVGVSWHEAIAFCTWLRDFSGEQIWLPTEQMWQRAAQALPEGPNSNYMYPWGNQWNETSCQNSVSNYKTNKTSPVTRYEKKGASPCGVTDMVGNSNEWCATAYKTGQLKFDGRGSRVIKGGCWGDVLIYALNSVTRYKAHSDYRSEEIGFRIAKYQ